MRWVKLARFCTMRVGGPADLFTTTKTKAELAEVLRLAHKLGIKYFVLAGGSNVVFPDKGWRGLVVRYTANKMEIICHPGQTGQRPSSDSGSPAWKNKIPGRARNDERTAEVEAGMMLGDMVRKLLKQNLGGFNFLANIPGSVGGAIVGNAGCYGKEIKDYLQGIEVFNVKTGKITMMKPKELAFGYRDSKLKRHPELVVLGANFRLDKIDKKQATKEIAAEKQSRCNKHPHSPSCGSWFKNPSRDLPAWKLIDQAGLRGATVGGARVSNKHPNFIVNYRSAQTKDIVKLVQLVKKKVKQTTKMVLEEEVKLIK